MGHFFDYFEEPETHGFRGERLEEVVEAPFILSLYRAQHNFGAVLQPPLGNVFFGVSGNKRLVLVVGHFAHDSVPFDDYARVNRHSLAFGDDKGVYVDLPNLGKVDDKPGNLHQRLPREASRLGIARWMIRA